MNIKTLLLALGLALSPALALAQGQALGPPNYTLCNLNTGTTLTSPGVGSIQIVTAVTTPVGPGSVGPSTYVCGGVLTASAATTFALAFGTGAACATGTTNLTPPLNVGSTPTTFFTNNPTIVAPPGKNLCVIAGGALNGLLFFSQF